MVVFASLPANAAQQITGQIVGTTGTAVSPRFGVLGSVQAVEQAPSGSVRFVVAPLSPTQRDLIFAGGFE